MDDDKLGSIRIGTWIHVAELIVLIAGGFLALGTFKAEMEETRSIVKPLATQVQAIDTRTQVMQVEQKELDKRVDRIEGKIDNAAEMRKENR